MDLGSVIKKLRINKHYSQKHFAEMCDISQTYLSLIESNKKEPNLSTLKVLSHKLEVPLPIIFFDALDIDDIPEEKRSFFNAVSPSFNNLIESILSND